MMHRVVERGAVAFLDRVELAGDVGDLLDEEPVHLEPVGRVGVREQVVDHVIDAEVREPQRGVVVVQLQGAERGCVSVWKARTRMSHISRMCSAMSCGTPSAGRGMFGWVERRPPALELVASLPARSIRCSTSRTEFRYSSSLSRSERLMLAAERARVVEHGVEDALVALLRSSLNSRSKASAG